jgi:dTDP-4-amino-4,6-dideoxygalactose transaminase
MSLRQLACLGGKPQFNEPIPVGQLYFPDWSTYETAMTDIFERQYYTNHGPLVQRLEHDLSRFLSVRHVICVTNATIGLIIAAEAMELSGKVLMPGLTFVATALSLSRCGLEPIFCDVDPETLHITTVTLNDAYEEGVSAVLGVNLWGSAADTVAVEAWADSHDLITYWDSAQAMGCSINGQALGGNGILEVFSMHATKIVSAGEGGFITTNDDDMADRLRNIRSSYGARGQATAVKTTNGRMSELQASIGILSLQNYEKNVNHNLNLRETYIRGLAKTGGINVEPLHGVSNSNASSLLIRVNEGGFGVSRDILHKALIAENILARNYYEPNVHRIDQFAKVRQWNLPHTDNIQCTLLALPLGSQVSEEAARSICDLIFQIAEKSEAVVNGLC